MVLEESNVNAKVEIAEQVTSEHQADIKEQGASSERNLTDNADSVVELEKAKADEIAKSMNENEQLKSLFERKSNEAEIESLREEYHQRISTLERKENFMFVLSCGKEIPYVCDATALLKGKYEIITQVMAEGEELSKKRAAQESQIRKRRAQIREFEEEKKGLITKLQAEENKVDMYKEGKAITEKLLEETIKKNQAEFAAQKEFYSNALIAAKEAEALAESGQTMKPELNS